MKELSIAEKAKAYDEALERAKRYYNEYKIRDNILYVEDMEDMFPELKGSEDKRTKEAIIATIHLYCGEPLEDEAKEMIAWLEKQGKHNPAWSEDDEKIYNRVYECGDRLGFPTAEFIDEFRKYMED